jgi:tetratricopeptide (TPR) repeat protein
MPRRCKILVLYAICALAFGQSIRELYDRTQQGLRSGDLAAAETAIRQILAIAPNDPGAHGNLAVVYMRRHKWEQALTELRTTQRLAPNVAGVRLNIALIYYHQNRFELAIPQLEAFLREQPGVPQATYLLSLCDVFTGRYVAALPLLQALWDAHSTDLAFLYVMAVATDGAHRDDLEKNAINRMLQIGKDSAEVHLYIGKAYLSRQQDENALKELETAAKLNPRLPFVHYFLGAVARRLGNQMRARDEFLADVAIEPDVALDYDQLGSVSLALSQPSEAERYFRQAIRLQPDLASSHFGLAKLLVERKDWKDALVQIDAAARLVPDSAAIHYVRAQVLRGSGREAEAKREFLAASRIQASARDKLQELISGKTTPDPDLPTLR